jgi:hypothetical protein
MLKKNQLKLDPIEHKEKNIKKIKNPWMNASNRMQTSVIPSTPGGSNASPPGYL